MRHQQALRDTVFVGHEHEAVSSRAQHAQQLDLACLLMRVRGGGLGTIAALVGMVNSSLASTLLSSERGFGDSLAAFETGITLDNPPLPNVRCR